MSSNKFATVNKVVIVGGGTAGWLSAAIIGAKHLNSNLSITLIESPDVSTIGVGEGTWPSMRQTLAKIGLSETDFIKSCDASFKQASKFIQWQPTTISGNAHSYYHPFSLPENLSQLDPGYIHQFSQLLKAPSFAEAFCAQLSSCEQNLAPKQIGTPEFSFIANYGYHLDATKLACFIKKHCIEKLNVTYVQGHVEKVENNEQGDISRLVLNDSSVIAADLFVDCSGQHSRLIDKHYGIPFVSHQSVLFNDSALAVQLTYEDEDQTIESSTLSTAQRSGWIWDIGLQSRRGVGYVYASAYETEDDAKATLLKYVLQTSSNNKIDLDSLKIKKLQFKPGHREVLWHKNCVAVGMSAGFIEPLEASAIAMIEQSASYIADHLPKNTDCMGIIAKRFNHKMLGNWEQIIDFLKLHYVLSTRDDSPYWRDNKMAKTIPDSLQEKLTLWQHQAPSMQDISYVEPLFPMASYQYVLYGMGFTTESTKHSKKTPLQVQNEVLSSIDKVQIKQKKLSSILTTNRKLIEKIHQQGFSKV